MIILQYYMAGGRKRLRFVSIFVEWVVSILILFNKFMSFEERVCVLSSTVFCYSDKISYWNM